MRGIIHLMVQSVHLKYEMDFYRNITILKGDSATGKTTLVDMIQEYNLNGSDTGIILSCNCPCRVISGNTWEEQLKDINGSLVFIDEGNRFVASEDFARAIRKTDNYYVIVTRESLGNLPYSVTEIYGIHCAGKYAYQKPVYHQMYRIYGDYNNPSGGNINKLLIEDSNSGFDYFSGVSQNHSIECVSAQGASNIYHLLQEAESKNGITVIADGAAFGAQMEKVYQLILSNPGITIYLPESFEWLVLSADILNDTEIKKILENPSDYIECSDHFSWERYFTNLLIEKTNDTYLKYSKTKLNPAFLQGKNCEKIIEVLPKNIKDVLRKR